MARVMRDAGAAAASLGVEIVGGHSEVTRGIDRTIVVMTAVGRAPRARLVHSGGARPGDRLLVTKGAGIEGTAILAADLEARLRPALGDALIERAQAFRGSPERAPGGTRRRRRGRPRDARRDRGGRPDRRATRSRPPRASGSASTRTASPSRTRPRRSAGCLGADPLALIGSGALLIATPDPARTAGRGACGRGAGRGDRRVPGRGRAGRRAAGRTDAPLVPAARDELWRLLEEAAGLHPRRRQPSARASRPLLRERATIHENTPMASASRRGSRRSRCRSNAQFTPGTSSARRAASNTYVGGQRVGDRADGRRQRRDREKRRRQRLEQEDHAPRQRLDAGAHLEDHAQQHEPDRPREHGQVREEQGHVERRPAASTSK